ncbi:hydantoinase/oxoprolinase family protein [Psychrobacter sp. I-STPA10]|uniref:hydantoinase/oxoprolinase family protein n=1 Tax=Psychrobacter sp. I-STPA10 TaxID=2585769 RepID=UPI001E5BD455|nr:hydantoinase/oxoprolinase family protein [Psychrobacter sp. I-STPA10]
MLVNIDNGGTLTDICVVGKDEVYYTKTLTTPIDLSECFFEGISKAAKVIYGAGNEEKEGKSNFTKLLQNSSLIRYSSTQGTNALVERKGPKIGLITDEPDLIEKLNQTDAEKDMFQSLIGSRVSVLQVTDDEEEMDLNLVNAINELTTAGAERLIIAVSDQEKEKKYKHFFLLRFPRQLLGSVPVLFSWEFTTDPSRPRRIWSAIINTFLHPTLDNFLYSAENRLRAHKVKNPLLIYRNDGASSRVAKSVALKTYSSGPRGGLEGTRALAEAYGFNQVLMIDVGGTTSDIGAVDNLSILADRRGKVEGIETSFELSDVRSYGVGGSSILRAKDGAITVGPESVGAAPGPACFGFGGKEATITDVNLLLGILDPSTYLNGELNLDADRSRQVVKANVADPLGISVEEALFEMQEAFATKMANSLEDWEYDGNETVLAAFGGGGPMSACQAARKAGIKRVIIPKLAAIFSAYGLSFSNVSQEFEEDITGFSDEEMQHSRKRLLKQAKRHMYQEGYSLKDDCDVHWSVIVENADGSEDTRLTLEEDANHTDDQRRILVLEASYALAHPTITATLPDSNSSVEAKASGSRKILRKTDQNIAEEDVPVYVLDDQPANAAAQGPAIVEGPFFTARVTEGWSFVVSDAGDLILSDNA